MPVESNILNRIAKDWTERHFEDSYQLLNSKHYGQERNTPGLELKFMNWMADK